jgi:hypothetical protein
MTEGRIGGLLRSSLVWRNCSYALGTLALIWLPTSAQASCTVAHYTFHFGVNDHVSTSAVMTSGGCPFNPGAGGGTAFASMSVAVEPSHGTFSKTGPFTLWYKPKSGYKGHDAFAYKICEANNGGSDCATVSINATVN